MTTTKKRINSIKRTEDDIKKKKQSAKYPDLAKMKFTYDVEKNYNKILNSYSSYYNDEFFKGVVELKKDLKNFTEDDFNKLFSKVLFSKVSLEGAINFEFEISSDSYLKRLSSMIIKCDEKDIDLLVSLKMNSTVNIFIPLAQEIKIPKKTRKHQYFIKGLNRKPVNILSIGDVLSYLHVTITSYNFFKSIENSTDFGKWIFSQELIEQKIINSLMNSSSNVQFSENSSTNYSLDDINKLIDYNNSSNAFYRPNKLIKNLINEAYLNLIEIEYNNLLDEKYNAEIKSEYAKSYMDKKNTPEKILKLMKESKFSEFEKLELDADINLTKYKHIEKEYAILQKSINLKLLFANNQKPTLRFRKLGQHKASGLYYPVYNCVCVDVRSTKSFFHEIGHCIDYTADNGLSKLSARREFIKIALGYKKDYSKYLNSLDKDDPRGLYLKNKKHYFYTQTEIFARSFEYYLSKYKNLESSFLRESFLSESGYPPFSENTENEIKLYFDNLLKTLQVTINENITTLIDEEAFKEELSGLTFFQNNLEIKNQYKNSNISLPKVTQQSNKNSKENFTIKFENGNIVPNVNSNGQCSLF